MKNKTKTYILLIAVLGLWGTIAYKILTSLNPKLPEIQERELAVNFNPKGNTSIDTFSVKLMDRDPFLGTLSSKSKPKVQITKKKPLSPWIPISYQGVIKSQNPKEQVFVLSINGKGQLLKKGQQIDSITLLRGNSKAVVLRYKNQQKSFKRVR